MLLDHVFNTFLAIQLSSEAYGFFKTKIVFRPTGVSNNIHCKLLHFENLICITHYPAQQNNKALVMIRNNTNQVSWFFTYSTAQLLNILSNEVF